jgi:hypothetical protein
VVGDIVLENAGAEGGPRALEQVEVLEQERHAGERAIRQPFIDLPPRMVVVPDNDRVDRRIDFFRARNRFVQQLGSADLFLSDQIGKAYTVIIAVFLEGHLDPPRCQGFDAKVLMPRLFRRAFWFSSRRSRQPRPADCASAVR